MLSALALQFAGFVALAAAMPRHGRHIAGRLPSRREERVAASLGWLALALSLGLALRVSSDAIDLMAWIGAVPLAAGLVLLALSYRPAWLRPATVLALLVAVAGLIA